MLGAATVGLSINLGVVRLARVAAASVVVPIHLPIPMPNANAPNKSNAYFHVTRPTMLNPGHG